MARNYTQGNTPIRSASSLSRIFECPGSLKLSEGLDEIPNADADKGTDAHEWLEAAVDDGFLDKKTVPEEYHEGIQLFLDEIKRAEDGLLILRSLD